MKRVVRQSGVTLIEMLVVVGILAMLVTVFKFGMTRLEVQSDEQAVQRFFTLLDNALSEYHDAKGLFPVVTHIGELYRELDTVPEAREIMGNIDAHWGREREGEQEDWLTDWIDNEAVDTSSWPPLRDPWGRPFTYQWMQGDGDVFPRLRSDGPDLLSNTADDILNR